MQASAEWKAKLKKECVLVTIQNTTPYTLTLSGSALREGTLVKKSNIMKVIGPSALEEMGIKKPEAEFVWEVKEDDPAQNQLRLQLSFKGQQAKIEPIPPTAIWTVDLQQQWQRQPCPQVLITIMSRELVNTEQSPIMKHKKPKSRKDVEEGTGTLDPSTSAAAAKRHHTTGLKKKRKDSATLSGSAGSSDKKDTPPPAGSHEQQLQQQQSGFQSHDFDHDSDSDSDDRPKANRRISVIIKDKSQIDSHGDELKSMASALGAALKAPSSATLRRPESSSFLSNFSAPTTANNHEDLFANFGNAPTGFGTSPPNFGTSPAPVAPPMSEDEQVQLALAISASEADTKKPAKKKSSASPSPRNSEPSADALSAFTDAIDILESGNLVSAKQKLKQAIQSLGKNPTGSYAKEWASYSIVVDLLLEMQRLESERLWEQRALIARFAAEVAAASFSNVEHRLLLLRSGVNRNFEIGNFLTASQLLSTMLAEHLSDEENATVHSKLSECRKNQYREKFVPRNCVADPGKGLTLNDQPLHLCLKTYKLLRAKPYSVCNVCEAHYDKSAGVTKCIYGGNALTDER